MKLLVACAVFVAQGAFAITGNEALQSLTGSSERLQYLQFYAKGLVDAEIAVKINAEPASKSGAKFIVPFCTPAGSTPVQAAMIIENHLRRSPENNHLDLYFVARRALVNAWPCPEYGAAIGSK